MEACAPTTHLSQAISESSSRTRALLLNRTALATRTPACSPHIMRACTHEALPQMGPLFVSISDKDPRLPVFKKAISLARVCLILTLSTISVFARRLLRLQFPRMRAITRLKRPGDPVCSSCPVDAGLLSFGGSTGIGALSSTRPRLTSTTRRSVTWHSEQMKVWCSTPGTVSRATFVRIIDSAPHAVQRITCIVTK